MFKNNHAAVRADRRKPHVATLKRGDLVRFAAAIRNPPNVCEATPVAIADEVDSAILAPHGP